MRTLSTQSRADIYASDAVPPHRDAEGIACFYRLDLANAYEAGFHAAQPQPADAPKLTSGHGGYDVQKAAKDWKQNFIKSTSAKCFSDGLQLECAFKAGSDWQRDKLAPMFVQQIASRLTDDELLAEVKRRFKEPS